MERSQSTRPPSHKLSHQQRQALAAVVETGPDPAIHGVVGWRRCHRAAWHKEASGVSLAQTTVGKELRPMGDAQLSARPRHSAQGQAELAAFTARLAEIRATLAGGVQVKIRWQEEARIGQNNRSSGAGQSAAPVR